MGLLGLIMLFVLSPEDTVGLLGLIMLFVRPPADTVGLIKLQCTTLDNCGGY